MSDVITGVASFSNTHTTPAPGDLVTDASVDVPFQSLANNDKFFYDLCVTNGVNKIRTAASIAALKAITGMLTGELAFVVGYGLYRYIDPDSTTEELPYRIIAPTVGTGRWFYGSALVGLQTANFTANGTWVVPAGVTKIWVAGCGGGGGGAGGAAGGLAINRSGLGGGAGASAPYRSSILNVTPGETLTVTIGAGGASGVGGPDGITLPYGGDVGTESRVVGASQTARFLGGGGGNAGVTITSTDALVVPGGVPCMVFPGRQSCYVSSRAATQASAYHGGQGGSAFAGDEADGGGYPDVMLTAAAATARGTGGSAGALSGSYYGGGGGGGGAAGVFGNGGNGGNGGAGNGAGTGGAGTAGASAGANSGAGGGGGGGGGSSNSTAGAGANGGTGGSGRITIAWV